MPLLSEMDDDELADAAEITERDIEEARAWNEQYMPEPFDGLFEAEAASPEEIEEIRGE